MQSQPDGIEFHLLRDRFHAKLLEYDLKHSQKREIILRVLFETSLPLSVEEIYQKTRKQYPQIRIGMTTVYRTLWLLEECEMVSSVLFYDKGVRYQLIRETGTIYVFCDRCRSVERLYDELLQTYQETMSRLLHHLYKGSVLKIHGVCRQCQKHRYHP